MTLTRGKRVGHYEIVEAIGHGGMSDVYRARDIRLDRHVALKVLAEHLARDRQALQRFEQEAKAVAALSHPNILAIHDYGSSGAMHYSATELLEGETLRSRLLQGPVPWRRAIEIAAAIADGLAAAHAKGIVHRDLKPENIFLVADGRVKILDFGVAQLRREETKDTDASETPTAPLNARDGAIVGTAGYMSPEQLRAEEIGPTSDIFSLGCVLYEMLAARPAFLRSTMVDTLSAVLTSDPEPITERTNNPVPWELWRVIQRCLEKQPGARFQSASDLAFALRALSTSTNIDFRPPRRRKLVAISALVLLIPLISAWFVVRGFRDARAREVAPAAPIEALAILPFENAPADPDAEYVADGLTEGLINRIAQMPGLRVMSRTTVFHFKGRRDDPRAIGRDLKVDAVLAGRLRQSGDSIRVTAELVNARDGSQIWSFDAGGAPADLAGLQERLARELAEKLEVRMTGEHRERLAKHDTESALAYDLYLRGRYQWNKRSAEGLYAAIEFFNRAIEADPNYALAYAGLADCYNLLDIWAGLPTSETFPKAKAAAEKALALDEQLAEAHTSLAYAIHSYEWDWTRAEAEYRRALELNPNYATARQWYAEMLTATGRFDDARREGEAALRLDPLSPIIHAVVGWNECMARRYRDSIARNRETVQLFPSFMPGHAYLGLAYLESDRPDQAMEALKRALDIADIVVVRTWYLRAQAARGDVAAARDGRADLERRGRSEYLSPYYMGALDLALGNSAEGLRLIEKALDDRTGACVWIKVDPALDGLRDDPRFQELERRVFPPASDSAAQSSPAPR